MHSEGAEIERFCMYAVSVSFVHLIRTTEKNIFSRIKQQLESLMRTISFVSDIE